MKQEKLIFVLSPPRAGSTLLQSLLSKSSSIQTVSEPWLLLPHLVLNRPDLVRSSFDWDATGQAVNEFIDTKIGREFYSQEQRKFLLQIYSKIQNRDSDFVLDKTPRYFEITDEIKYIFPEAKYIYLKRNPLSIFKSILEYGNITNYSQLLWWGRDLLIAPEKLNKYERNSIICRYEELVVNPGGVLNSLLEQLGIKIEELDFNLVDTSNIKGSFGDSNIHSKNEIDTSSVEKWKTLLLSSKWKGFTEGYVNYLLENNLIEDEYMEIRKYARKNKDFDLFCKIVFSKMNENHTPRESLNAYLKFKFKSILFNW